MKKMSNSSPFLYTYIFTEYHILGTGEKMEYKIGDRVTRKSYQNDTVFVIVDIQEDNYILKGLNIRLIADSPKEDLQIYNEEEDIEQENPFLERVKICNTLDRDDYFYLTGKILHIDADEDYLNRCLDYYKTNNLWAVGIHEQEAQIPYRMRELLEEYRPTIVVITGHDAYLKKNRGDYQNSFNFIETVKEARKYEKSQDKLIIIAGACQSNYEELIKAGANFASSPKRINIHALDPAILATSLALSDRNKSIDLLKILEKTKYGKDGMGGIITNGTMYVGYPR